MLLAVTKIKLLCVLASQTGLKRVAEEFPGLEVCFNVVFPLFVSHHLYLLDMGGCG